MTTQKLEAETAYEPASTHDPNCGKVISPEVLKDFGDPTICGQRQLVNRVFEAHDQDRQSLASELHEDLSQRMTGALLRLQALERLLQGVPENATRELHKAQKLLSHSIGAARRIANRLQPPALAQFGLVAGIDCLTAGIARDGQPAIEFSCDEDFARVAPTVEIAAFRVVQELLENVLRHSQSRKVWVDLVRSNGHVQLEVHDWGIGFDPAQVNGDGFGLREVRERVKLLGGRIEIDSAPGNGTRVVVELPVGNNSTYDT